MERPRDHSLLPCLLTSLAVLVAACTDARSTEGADAFPPEGGSQIDSATPSCTMGVDCPVCTARISRCGGADGQAVETCSADGVRFEASEMCDPSAGTVCAQGACVPITDTPACQEASAERSYLGCEFWPTTVAHAHLRADTVFAVAVANPHAESIAVRVTGGALDVPEVRHIEGEGLEIIELPYVDEIARARTSGLIASGAYRVETSRPAAVTQFNPLTSIASADASTLLPTAVLGERYRVLTSTMQNVSREHPGSFAVVATAPGSTAITVQPTVATSAGGSVPRMRAGQSREFSLEQGDVLQILAEGFSDDLSGSAIDASAPVAVISGHLCATFPGTACDHLEEQTFPEAAWGDRYVVGSFGSSSDVEYVIRILASQPNTRVTFDPPSTHAPMTLDAGEVFQLITTGQAMVQGDKPILVGQFVAGRGSGGEDPSLTYAVPLEQYRAHSVFLAAPEFDENFANIVGPTDSPPIVDGVMVANPGSPIGTTGLSIWRVSLEGGTHRVGVPGGTAAYGVTVYGFRSAGSYAYPAGMDQREINPLI